MFTSNLWVVVLALIVVLIIIAIIFFKYSRSRFAPTDNHTCVISVAILATRSEGESAESTVGYMAALELIRSKNIQFMFAPLDLPFAISIFPDISKLDTSHTNKVTFQVVKGVQHNNDVPLKPIGKPFVPPDNYKTNKTWFVSFHNWINSMPLLLPGHNIIHNCHMYDEWKKTQRYVINKDGSISSGGPQRVYYDNL